jgi:GMP synthase-like glutamine amidotransferase
MRTHFLQHVPFESPGQLQSILLKQGSLITKTALFDNAPLPAMDEFDLLIILGGPMSVNDESSFEWLVREKDFIRRCINHQKPVLGICLGAQLIANALGATVYKNSVKEIGWFPIQRASQPQMGAFNFPDTLNAFHWHGETFDMPHGALLLASSEATPHQAFQFGATTIALQCHLEATPDSINALIASCANELSPAPFVQSSQTITSTSVETFNSIHAVLENIISFLITK